MIDGVTIKQLAVHNDVPDLEQEGVKAGYLMEVLRSDEEIFTKFGQSTFTVAYQGMIKAFHWHEKQDDLWFVATGRAAIVLHDLRDDSSSKGETQVVYAGENDYKLVSIPVGVAHGYKVLSKEPVLLFYHTTEPYNAQNPDELRVAYDDSKIGFEWNKIN